MKSSDKLAGIYKTIALHTFNSLVLIIFINLVLAGVFLWTDAAARDEPAVDRKVMTHREEFSDPEAYTAMNREEMEGLLNEQDVMGSIGFQHEPWRQFRNPEFHGTYLNTDARGFRKTKIPRLSRGDPIKVYVLGGSTTFGYGVADDYTIPSFMQSILERDHPDVPIQVKNFGQGFYYSTQEMQLLISLIKDLDIPHIVLFIDGANDTHQLHFMRDQPYFTDIARNLWNTRAGLGPSSVKRGPSRIPMVRLAGLVSQKLKGPPPPQAGSGPGRKEPDKQAAEEALREANGPAYVARRYRSNLNLIRSICRAEGISCFFIWQPVPFYQYDRTLHRTFPYKGEIPGHWSAVYKTMKYYSAPDYLYLGELLKDVHEKIFVDDVHYNEKYNEKIAAELCEFLKPDLDRLIGSRERSTEAAPGKAPDAASVARR